MDSLRQASRMTQRRNRSIKERKHVRPPEGQARLRHRRRRRASAAPAPWLLRAKGPRCSPPTSTKPSSPRSRAKASRKWQGSTRATPPPSPPWPSAPARPTSCSTPQASCITAPCWIAPTKTGIFPSTSTSSRCTARSARSCRACWKAAAAAIVNISSAAGVFKAAPNRYVYGATKAAVAALTRAVAVDFITKGIRCNCICPGTIETPSMLERAAAAGPQRTRDVRRAAADGTARHRRGNRFARRLSRQRRKRVHHRRRAIVIDGG